ncbi:hypothetical protein N7520_003992 [Penicillium odoratum]|uniref:uncharacterized protein n=1 Tax=Penicillium odoratum TaxID=1167516 RepID=UPI0025465E15|nr:uncharacterized protein N7520_003992 [Penicillium odoratum]KAJ5769433.1 hypothetical protein N7520_003992 [Penicillium odoratum]
MTLDYTVNPVTSSDLPALTNLIHSAKLALSINRLIFLNWPNEKLQVTLYSRAVQGGYDDPVTECFKAVDNETQEIIGYIVLERKTPQDSQESEKTERSVPDGLNPPLLADVENATRQIAKEVNDMHRFDVIYMCVKPAFQGRGIGSQLVQLGFDRAKAEDIPLSVCAEAPSIPFFKKIGFKETIHVDMDLQKYAPAHSGFGVFRLAGMIWYS